MVAVVLAPPVQSTCLHATPGAIPFSSPRRTAGRLHAESADSSNDSIKHELSVSNKSPTKLHDSEISPKNVKVETVVAEEEKATLTVQVSWIVIF